MKLQWPLHRLSLALKVTGNPAPVYEVLRKVGAVIPDSRFSARARMTRVQEQAQLSISDTQRPQHPRTFVVV